MYTFLTKFAFFTTHFGVKHIKFYSRNFVLSQTWQNKTKTKFSMFTKRSLLFDERPNINKFSTAHQNEFEREKWKVTTFVIHTHILRMSLEFEFESEEKMLEPPCWEL